MEPKEYHFFKAFLNTSGHNYDYHELYTYVLDLFRLREITTSERDSMLKTLDEYFVGRIRRAIQE